MFRPPGGEGSATDAHMGKVEEEEECCYEADGRRRRDECYASSRMSSVNLSLPVTDGNSPNGILLTGASPYRLKAALGRW